MAGFLTGKKAIVTGGTKGIGLEVARALLVEGADVVVCGRDVSSLESAVGELQRTRAGCKVSGHAADVSNSAAVRNLFQLADRDLEGLDILVNNAGSGVFLPASELSVEDWDRTIGTNLSGAFYCSHEALARFKKGDGGWIINISSLAGRNAIAGGAAYNASKFGLNGMSEAIMLDHRHENVKVSYIMPGSVDTKFNGHSPSGASDWKIAPEDIGEIVIDILRKKGRTLVSRVEVRPAKPPRK
jgi:3-oxoacyl-[acyl-carrier protein] reductase